MRLHYFDNGKALASILGFFYHVGLIFSVPWIINTEPENFSSVIYLFTQISTLFRMPLFMFIAGYFAIYSVKKYDFNSFVKNKLFRLGLPLLSTLIVFVFIQNIYSDILFKRTSTIIDVINKLIPWSSTFNLEHLWFLYLVLIYSFLLYFIENIMKKHRNFFLGIKDKIFNLKTHSSDILLIFFTAISSLSFILFSILSPVSHALLPFNDFGMYLSYFIMGIFTYIYWDKYSKLFFNFNKKRFFYVLAIVIITFIPSYMINSSDNLLQIIQLLFASTAKYFSLLLILYILYNFFNNSNKALKYLSDSSYSIYLLHQPVIVVVSYYYLKHVNIPSYILYLAILITSILIAYLIDFLLIKNTKLGKFLFTGQ